MNYKTFENRDEFLKAILETIDFRRTVMLFNDPDLKIKDSKTKTIKKVFSENLKFIFPDSVYQVGSDVKMAFTRFDPKMVGQIADFWFMGINVYPMLSAPVFIALFVDSDDNVCYFVPAQGNTFNVLTGKPFGQDETDETSCSALCGCTIEELCVNPEKHQDLEIMKKEICDQFDISQYSMLVKTDIKDKIENLFAFTKKSNEDLL